MAIQAPETDERGERPDALDALVLAYLALPLMIFVVGWFKPYAAMPLLACVFFALRTLGPAFRVGFKVSRLQLLVAVSIAVLWTLLGGLGHVFFANPDWHVRDAVLHDLVNSAWPVGYGDHNGQPTILRAPLGYFLVPALIGKSLGLLPAHWCLAFWTALGAALFLLQVFSLAPSRPKVLAVIGSTVILFSGLDFVGGLLNFGPRFLYLFHPGLHIEWWAGLYQYSSITTQLFWVPNHALAAWLAVGFLWRNRGASGANQLLPIITVACLLWSPLSTLGLIPFVLWSIGKSMWRERSARLASPVVWLPSFILALAVSAFFALDAASIPHGLSGHDSDFVSAALRQLQFFFIEAGFIGMAVVAIRPSSEVCLALLILALLPAVSFGPANDIVMRASIPSLAVLAIGSALSLLSRSEGRSIRRRKVVLAALLMIGAITPISELSRAAVVPAWPINQTATLIGVDCGGFPPHYVAHVGSQEIFRFMKAPQAEDIGPIGKGSCNNPGWELMYKKNLL